MTEQSWNICSDPSAMLEFLRRTGKLSERKARLFAVACCRRVRDLTTDAPNQMGADIAERYADGLASSEELAAATTTGLWAPVLFAVKGETSSAIWFAARAEAGNTVQSETGTAPWSEAKEGLWTKARARACLAQAEVLRDIFGNPFHPLPRLEPCLLTSVADLASAAYEDRNLPSGTLKPEHLLALADALEAAGCHDAELLEHLRSEGPHVRGCWALDVVLGKS